jgi:hypothetical protein
MTEILKDFMANYRKLPSDEQAATRVKGVFLGLQFIVLVAFTLSLCVDAAQALSERGQNPLIAPIAFTVGALLFYKLLVFLIRSGTRN